ncbi:MAG: hypothetical protein FD125_1105 [bacterium]|nr:MAG: hypothetical protein FD125_1105 [bacterium]
MARTAVVVWIIRLALLVSAFLAPALTYAVRSAGTGNAEQAIEGFWAGFAIAIALLVGFSLTFRTSPVRRLGYLGLGVTIVVLGWIGTLWLANIWPALA